MKKTAKFLLLSILVLLISCGVKRNSISKTEIKTLIDESIKTFNSDSSYYVLVEENVNTKGIPPKFYVIESKLKDTLFVNNNKYYFLKWHNVNSLYVREKIGILNRNDRNNLKEDNENYTDYILNIYDNTLLPTQQNQK